MIVVFFVCAVLPFAFADGVAEAVLPSHYEASVSDGALDWYFGADFLDLATLKDTVATWFEDEETYDFSALEQSPIIVAVIDTGINFEHEIFAGKYDADGNPLDVEKGEYDVLFRDEDGNIVGKNTVVEAKHKSDSILDDSSDGHGTHVAGVIATLIHALNLEKYIKIMPIKAGYPATGGSTFALEAVNQAIAFALEHGASVVNMSFTSTNKAYGKAITSDMAEQAVLVAAAGNDSKVSEGTILAKAGYPAASDNVIGVMNATYSGDEWTIYSSSNYGNAYQLAAPGGAIYSADSTTTNGYKKLNGTSMASPFVSFGAALCALKYSAIAEASGSENAKTPFEIAQIIKGAATKTITYKNKKIKIFNLNKIAGEISVYAVRLDYDAQLLKQTVGQVESIKITASLLPSRVSTDETLAEIKWYERDGDEYRLLGEGKEIEYLPADAVGRYEIVAQIVYDGRTMSASAVFEVEYVVPDKDTTEIDVQNEDESGETLRLVVGESCTLKIAGYQSFNPETVVYWYVDGAYAGTGFEFEYVPSSCGEHKIEAKVNGELLSSVVTVKAVESQQMKDRTYTYVSIAVPCAIVLVVGIIVATYFVWRKKHAEREGE